MWFTRDIQYVLKYAFTEKRTLMRHIASVHNNESYDCTLCKKSLKRKDYLRRHQLSIHTRSCEISCSKCEKIFTRADNMRRHKKTCCVCKQCSKSFETIKELNDHNCSNLSDRKVISANCTNLSGKEAVSANKPVSHLEEDSKTTSCSLEALSKKKSLKIKRHSDIEAATCPAAKKSKHDIVEDEQMDETDDDIKEFMKKYWSSIRTFSRKNKVQNIFNFYYKKDLKEMVQNITETIMEKQKNCFKINYSLAYVLRNIETNELRYFHASYNNPLMLKTALLISNRKELLDFLNSIAEESFIENITRPDTKWKVIQISNLTFYINHLQDAPLGAPIPLPDFIINNHRLANVSAEEDNLCFFPYLAVFRGADHHRCNRAAKQLFFEYCTHFDVSEFSGVSLFDFVELKNFIRLILLHMN